jgi:hypothetical protein
MRGLMIVGVIIVLASLGALAVQVIPFHHQEQVAKIGPITATEDKQSYIFIPPFAAVIGILVGGGLIFAGRRGS